MFYLKRLFAVQKCLEFSRFRFLAYSSLFQCYTTMGHEQCTMSFFLKLLPSAAIVNGDKNRNMSRKLKVFPREVKCTFGILPQVQKFAQQQQNALTLAIPEIVYGSHDTKGNGVIVCTNEEKKGFLSPRQYSGLTLPEVTVVIDRISEIHAATTAMLISKSETDFSVLNQQHVDSALKEDTDLVFRTLAHFLRRVPGYMEKHHLICKYRQILVEQAVQPAKRYLVL